MKAVWIVAGTAPVVVGAAPRPLIISLDRVKAEDTFLVGGKGANLGKMLQQGLPVPPGFCVTTEAFRQYLASWEDSDRLWRALATLKPLPLEGAQACGARLREQLGDVPLPPPVEQAIAAAWQQHGPERAYAVRSSATAEDGQRVSFAGQGETYLNVRGRKAILDSVRSCWISLFTDRAILYRIHKGLDHRAVAMAVVVQELVHPDVAGVLFTVDPVFGQADRIVIEASYGLGAALAAGQIGSDRIVLGKPGLDALEREVCSKNEETVPRRTSGVRQRCVAQPRAEIPCVDEATAKRLGELALQAERSLGGPQDMEWAATKDQVFVLQSRPITTLRQPAEKPRTVWSNMNSWEVLPGVVPPMSWSLVNLHLEGTFAPVLKALGLEVDGHALFGLIAGRAYANLTTFAAIARAVPIPVRLDFFLALGGEQQMISAGPTGGHEGKGWRNRLRRLARLARTAIWSVTHAVDQRARWHLAEFQRHIDKLVSADLAAKSDAGLMEHLSALLKLDSRFGPDLAADVVVAAVFVHLFFRFVSRKLGGDGHGIANRLLGGLKGVASADAGLGLWQLAALVHEAPSLSAAVAQTSAFAPLCERLSGTHEGEEFLARWNAFMLRHGHHACGEFDVRVPRWSETPDDVLGMLRGYLDGLADTSPLEFQKRLSRRRSALANGCRRRLGSAAQIMVFDYLLRKAQFGMILRENVRNQVVRVLAAARQTLVELGKRWAQRGTLADPDDIFFLEVPELAPLLAGANLAATIAARRAAYAYHQTITPPPVIVGEFEPEKVLPPAAPSATKVLHGLPASAGVATGPARVMLRPQSGARVLPGEILVAPYTDPGWSPHFLTAAGIVMDVGGMLSHGSIIAREYGIPAVVNVGSATRIIKTGELISVDGNSGLVTILSSNQPTPSTARTATRKMENR